MRMHHWPSDVLDSHEAEWLEAERAERIERLEAQLQAATAEGERLQTELLIARCWVKELALWLDEVQMRGVGATLEALAIELGEPTLSWETLQRLGQSTDTPLAPRSLLMIGLLAAVSWLVVLGFAYGTWLLAS